MPKPTQTDLPFADPAYALRRAPPATEEELRVRAEALAGHTIAELATALGVRMPDEPRRAKGFVGQLVERALGADPDAGDQPDFVALGVELKTIPVNSHGHPVESTFCCAITMATADRELWRSSRLRHKLERVLWLPVEAAKSADLGQRRIGRAVLWSPTPEQNHILQADWEDLMGAVGSGGTVSAHDGKWLQVRPKAQNAQARTLGVGADGTELVRPLGFYLRARFTASLLADG